MLGAPWRVDALWWGWNGHGIVHALRRRDREANRDCAGKLDPEVQAVLDGHVQGRRWSQRVRGVLEQAGQQRVCQLGHDYGNREQLPMVSPACLLTAIAC